MFGTRRECLERYIKSRAGTAPYRVADNGRERFCLKGDMIEEKRGNV